MGEERAQYTDEKQCHTINNAGGSNESEYDLIGSNMMFGWKQLEIEHDEEQTN